MSKKTLKLRPASEQAEAPALQRKGRGWEVSEKRLDALHARARDMRRHPTEAHKVLAARFATAHFGRHGYKQQAVIGSAIVDFGFPTLGFAIAIDESVPGVLETRRDKSLEAVGVTVMRIAAADILADLDPVLARIAEAMRGRIADKRSNAREHRSHGPRKQAGGQ